MTHKLFQVHGNKIAVYFSWLLSEPVQISEFAW